MNNLVSVVYYVEQDSKINPFLLHQIGYKKVLEEQELITKVPVEKYVNTICGLQVEIIIGIKTSLLVEEESKWIYDVADRIFTIGDNKSNADAYNLLFQNCHNDYICILKNHFFTEANWLQDLMLFQKNISKTGVVGLASDFLSCEFVPMLSTDEENMIGVFLPKDEMIDVVGAYLFDKQLLFLVGAFDTSDEINGYEFLQWQMRCTRLGFHNYYIPTQSCIQLIEPKSYDEKKLQKVNFSVEEMRKNRNFYIPLITI
jgi:hypothetical protein